MSFMGKLGWNFWSKHGAKSQLPLPPRGLWEPEHKTRDLNFAPRPHRETPTVRSQDPAGISAGEIFTRVWFPLEPSPSVHESGIPRVLGGAVGRRQEAPRHSGISLATSELQFCSLLHSCRVRFLLLHYSGKQHAFFSLKQVVWFGFFPSLLVQHFQLMAFEEITDGWTGLEKPKNYLYQNVQNVWSNPVYFDVTYKYEYPLLPARARWNSFHKKTSEKLLFWTFCTSAKIF